MAVANEASVIGGDCDTGGARATEGAYERMRDLISGNAVVVFTIKGCCMCHVVKQLLFGLGVGPTIVELDGDSDHLCPGVPAVFVGGKFLGGIESVMACHINGSLVPLLKHDGALWL